MKKLIHIALAGLLTAVMVTGCGWHLRGSGQTLNNISSVYVSAPNRQSDFYRSLIRALKASKIEITPSATGAQYSIVALNEKSSRRTATVSAGARVSEYQLTEAIDILILDADGKQLGSRTTLSAERYFDFDENDVQSKREETELLQREMRNDLVRQIINRLNAISNRTSAPSDTLAEDAPAS